MKAKNFYRIGEISKLYNIGVDSIRYYEEVGILSPIRDKQNNYRLYTLDDIRKLTMIRELLDLNFSINQIKEFEDHRDVNNSLRLLNEELSIVNDTIMKLMETKNDLKARIHMMQHAQAFACDEKITVKTMSRRPCVMISETNLPDCFVNYAVTDYMKHSPQKIGTIGTCHCYTLDIKNSNPDSVYYRTKNVFIYSDVENYESNYVLPAGTYLSMTYKGSPEKTKQLVPLLYDYAKEQALEVLDDPIELCHIDEYDTVKIDEYITELQLKVASKG